MELAPGDRLGPYEVVAPLGAGGMGEVYRAHDRRLDRVVALKLVQSGIADAQFQERFDREARAISQLSHPHICVLYDVGHAALNDRPERALTFLVMEHVDGETLSARLARGALPISQTLTYAAEIADALDHAHRRGIVHRDLKPGNIITNKAGAKLLDFGLAKLQQSGHQAAADSAVPTLTAALTATGTILGTLQYMAPEQLEGRETDARTDIFALGAVVYEMATGKKAFDGHTHASVIAAILEREPPRISTLQPLSPPALDHIVSRCLAKDPDERWQSSRDVSLELKSLAVAPTMSTIHASSGRNRWARYAPFIAVGALAGVLVGAVATWRALRPTTRTDVHPARFVVATATANTPLPPVPLLAISPDGGRVVHAIGADKRLYIRSVDQVESTAIPGTEDGRMPFFSPDGQWLGFFSQGKLKRVRFDGSAPTTICDAPDARGGTWGPDGTIVFAPSAFSALSRVSTEDGRPEGLTALDSSRGELSHRWPAFLPDGTAVLFSIGYGPQSTFDQGDVAIYSLKTGSRRIVLQGATFPRVIRPGYLLFARGHSLLAAPFDFASQSVSGRAATVANSIAASAGWGSAQAAVADDGTLAYVPGLPEPDWRLIWIDHAGQEQPLPIAPRAFSRPRISPDGRRVLVIVRDANLAVWVYDTARGVFSPQASTKWEGADFSVWSPSAVWSPDGRMLAYTTNEGTEWKLWRKPLDGSAPEELLLAQPMQFAPTSWSPDGRTLAMDQVNLRTRVDVTLLPLTGARRLIPLLRTEVSEKNARFSPDGHLLAYDAGFYGSEIYVRAFPGPGPTVQVSNGGGGMPAWKADGRELFYWTPAGIMAASISPAAGLSAGAPRLLVAGNFSRDFDVMPDGRRFLVMKQYGTPPPIELQVVTGWLDHLRRALGETDSTR